MIISVASGKGGTGKTTISTNLAISLSSVGQQVQYIDCDAEEPNGHIFLKPDIEITEDVTVGVPEVNQSKCQGCGYVFDRFQSMSARPLEKCPRCNGKVQRLISGGAGVIFKGPGFYATDYAKSNAPVCGRDRPCCGRDTPCDNKPCES